MGVTQQLGTIPLAIQTDSSNNVGIGTSTIGGKLDVRAAATSAFSYYFRNAAGGYGGGVYNTGSNNTQLYLATSAGTENILLNTSGASYFNGGNVGIGTTSPTGTYGKLSVAGGISILDDNNAKLEIGRYSSGVSNSYIKLGANSNSLRFTNAADSVDLVTFTNSGNVGIGLSNPTALLEILGAQDGVANKCLRLAYNGTYYGEYTEDSIRAFNNPLIFGTGTGGTERMRITSGGEVLMNTTNVLSAGWLCVSVPSNNYNAIVLRDTGTSYSGANFYQIFTNSTNTLAGTISHPTATSVSYNTSSDYRLKEDFKDFNGLDLLSNIKFYDFKWKEEDKRMHGVIAHELEPIIPLAVSGEKDAVDKEGNIVAQGVDYSKIVPVIGKALQEAMAKIDELNAKVTALENK